MSSLPKSYISPEEYLARERVADFKSEYYAGEIFAMAGATEAHNLIVTNVVRELSAQLKSRPCRVYPSDMRVKVDPSGLYTYPDAVVACGEIRFEDEDRDTLLNPVIVVEVLSPSTEAYDRGGKFAQYRRLNSLKEYVVIAQDRYLVERFVRHEDGQQWILTEFSGPAATLVLPSIQCAVPLAEIYDKVEFPEPGVNGTIRPLAR
jgi:Uma2 family endonuclease